MTTFKHFDENGKFIIEEYEPLNANNIEQFVEAHGMQKTTGYIEALVDVCKELDNLLYSYYNTGFTSNTPHVIRKKLLEFLEEKHTLLLKEKLQPFVDEFKDKNFIRHLEKVNKNRNNL